MLLKIPKSDEIFRSVSKEVKHNRRKRIEIGEERGRGKGSGQKRKEGTQVSRNRLQERKGGEERDSNRRERRGERGEKEIILECIA
jgi:hypothetical protein